MTSVFQIGLNQLTLSPAASDNPGCYTSLSALNTVFFFFFLSFLPVWWVRCRKVLQSILNEGSKINCLSQAHKLKVSQNRNPGLLTPTSALFPLVAKYCFQHKHPKTRGYSRMCLRTTLIPTHHSRQERKNKMVYHPTLRQTHIKSLDI